MSTTSTSMNETPTNDKQQQFYSLDVYSKVTVPSKQSTRYSILNDRFKAVVDNAAKGGDHLYKTTLLKLNEIIDCQKNYATNKPSIESIGATNTISCGSSKVNAGFSDNASNIATSLSEHMSLLSPTNSCSIRPPERRHMRTIEELTNKSSLKYTKKQKK